MSTRSTTCPSTFLLTHYARFASFVAKMTQSASYKSWYNVNPCSEPMQDLPSGAQVAAAPRLDRQQEATKHFDASTDRSDNVRQILRPSLRMGMRLNKRRRRLTDPRDHDRDFAPQGRQGFRCVLQLVVALCECPDVKGAGVGGSACDEVKQGTVAVRGLVSSFPYGSANPALLRSITVNFTVNPSMLNRSQVSQASPLLKFALLNPRSLAVASLRRGQHPSTRQLGLQEQL